MKLFRILAAAIAVAAVSCADKDLEVTAPIGNPFMPLWEHVPDGEPRLFEDPDAPGHYRVYVTGSHDTRFDSYCGQDDRQWSAPVEDLSAWRDEGPIFSYSENGWWGTIYAPDLVEVTRRDDGSRKYYLYPHVLMRMPMVCVGDRPDGPFTPLNVGSGGEVSEGSVIGFDPGVCIEQVDDAGDPDYGIGYRAYAAWGFTHSSGSELDQNTMYSPRNGSPDWPDFVTEEFSFYEASSFRKVGNKYLYIYSGHSGEEYGLPRDNANLRYAYADSPRGPWAPGGILVDARGPVLSRDGSRLEESFGHNNTHGSLLEINGQWYVFYHRAPRGFGFARQAMVAPVAIEADEKPVSEGGAVRITAYDPYKGAFTVKAADGNEYTGAEVTSEGFWIYGLPPYRYYSAGYACYMSRPGTMQDNWDVWDNRMDIAGVQSGDILGYKYFALGGLKKAPKGLHTFPGLKKGSQFNIFLASRTAEAFKVSVWLDGPWEGGAWNGSLIAEVQVPAGASTDITRYSVPFEAPGWALQGKHALFLVAEGPEGVELCDIVGFGFSRKGKPMEFPQPPSVRFLAAGEPLAMPTRPVWTTDLNGLTDCTNYEVQLPEGVSFSDVSVEAAPGVKVERGTSSIGLTWNGKTKTYLFSGPEATAQLQNGDLIFVGLPLDYDAEGSSMDAAIASSTGQPGELNLIHTAIADVRSDGVWIIDATIAHGVDHHPLATFLQDFTLRDGSLPEFIVKRVKGVDVDAAVRRAQSYCGRGYDTRFLPDNEEQYCTELVQNSYLDASGNPVFECKPMNFLASDGTMPPYWEWLFGLLGMDVPQGVPGTNPHDMAESPLLETVNISFP